MACAAVPVSIAGATSCSNRVFHSGDPCSSVASAKRLAVRGLVGTRSNEEPVNSAQAMRSLGERSDQSTVRGAIGAERLHGASEISVGDPGRPWSRG